MMSAIQNGTQLASNPKRILTMQLIDFGLYRLYRAVISLHKHLFWGGQKRDFCPDRSLRWFGSNQLTDAKVVAAIAFYPHFQAKLDREEFGQV